MSSEIHQITINGFRCRYAQMDRPSLPTVVILAGAMQEIESLESLTSLFKKYSVYVVELPGQGGAEALDENYDCRFIAECLDKFVSRIIFDKEYHLFAYSYANLFAIDFLKLASKPPKKTILAASMAELPDEQRTFIKGLIRLSAKDCVQAFIEFITNPKLDSKRHQMLKRASVRFSHSYMRRYPAHFHNNTKRLLHYELAELADLRSECMTIAGELDPFVRPELSKDLANKIIGCKHTTIEASDHLFYLEQPDLTRRAIEGFFV